MSDQIENVGKGMDQHRVDACLPHAFSHGRQAPMVFTDLEGPFVRIAFGVCHCGSSINGCGGQHRTPSSFWIQFSRQSWIQFCFARSEEHTSELQSLMRLSYAVLCLQQKIT